MSKSKVQFQQGLSLTQFLSQYGLKRCPDPPVSGCDGRVDLGARVWA